MGRRGPKPKPVQILRLRGSWRGKKRGVGKSSDHKRPARPQWLKSDAKKLWDEYAPKLYKNGLLTTLNRHSFALLVCQPYGDFCEADRQFQDSVNKKGEKALMIKTSKGGIVTNPLIYIRQGFWSQFCKGCSLFGLTPADISNVRAVEKPSEDDEKTKFFKKGG